MNANGHLLITGVHDVKVERKEYFLTALTSWTPVNNYGTF